MNARGHTAREGQSGRALLAAAAGRSSALAVGREGEGHVGRSAALERGEKAEVRLHERRERSQTSSHDVCSDAGSLRSVDSRARACRHGWQAASGERHLSAGDDGEGNEDAHGVLRWRCACVFVTRCVTNAVQGSCRGITRFPSKLSTGDSRRQGRTACESASVVKVSLKSTQSSTKVRHSEWFRSIPKDCT